MKPCQVREEEGHVSWQQVETPARRSGGRVSFISSVPNGMQIRVSVSINQF